ncbi:MAG TPA: 4Fe-4S binding protein, partial [Thermoplasmata archaeon]|nr:4Fe-4S binding protein [Thermoplasmata archaeon]
MNWELAKERYKDKGVKARTQEYIRGRGTTAIVDEEVCMGCMHCFDNCAFEAISALERKFSLPDYTYSSRKATIIVENCVGCEKCAIVCPVDAINMITKFGYRTKEGKVVEIEKPAPTSPSITSRMRASSSSVSGRIGTTRTSSSIRLLCTIWYWGT